MNHFGTQYLERIDKRKARNLYIMGKSILIVPVRMKPDGFSFVATLSPANLELPRDERIALFKKMVNAFSYYNCSFKTGYIPAYYIRKDESKCQTSAT